MTSNSLAFYSLEVSGAATIRLKGASKMTEYNRLRKQWKYFERRRNSLAEKHHGKFVIIFNEKIHAFEDSEIAAHRRAKKDGLTSRSQGQLYIRRCIYKDEEVPAVVRTRVHAL